MSAPEELFALYIRAAKLPEPVREYKFHPQRRWRFDFCWPDRLFAVEIEGGMWINGRHNRAKGAIADMEKYNAATALGWMVFRFTPEQVRDGSALITVEGLLPGRGIVA